MGRSFRSLDASENKVEEFIIFWACTKKKDRNFTILQKEILISLIINMLYYVKRN